MALLPENPKPAPDKNAAQQDVFMREVEDGLREDEFKSAFKRFGVPAIIVLVLGLAGLAGWLWWDDHQKQQAGERGEQLTMALDGIEQGNIKSAEKQLAALAKDAGDGSEAAAKLMQAGIAFEKGKRSDAIKLLTELAADADAPQPYRDLANIREVSMRFDDMPPQQVIDRLKPLAMPGNPWFGSAGELVAIAYLKQGKPELAGPLFAAISRGKDVPESLRRRTRQMAGLLGVDAIDDAEKLVKEDAANAPGAPQPAAPVPAPAPAPAQP